MKCSSAQAPPGWQDSDCYSQACDDQWAASPWAAGLRDAATFKPADNTNAMDADGWRWNAIKPFNYISVI